MAQNPSRGKNVPSVRTISGTGAANLSQNNAVFAIHGRFIRAIEVHASRNRRPRPYWEKKYTGSRQADTGITGGERSKRATGQSRSFARIYGNRFTRLTKECRLPLRLSTCAENRLVSPSLLLGQRAFVLDNRHRFCRSPWNYASPRIRPD